MTGLFELFLSLMHFLHVSYFVLIRPVRQTLKANVASDLKSSPTPGLRAECPKLIFAAGLIVISLSGPDFTHHVW